MSATDLQPCQILCLEHEATRLYGELIQIIPERNLCWLRPIALLDQPQSADEAATLYDLRQGADLLCPQTLFRVALDTEVLPIITQLEMLKAQNPVLLLEVEPLAHQQLQAFIQKIWQAHPSAFQVPL